MKKTLFFRIILFLLPLCIAFSSLACGKKNNSSQGGSEKESESASQESIFQPEEESESQRESQSESLDNNESTQTPSEEEPLVDFVVEVEEGRDIRVLQLTDIQTIDGSQQRYQARIGTAWVGSGGPVVRYRNQLRQVIRKYNPDLIIMTGDNVYGEFDDSGKNLLELVQFMDSFKIPWAPIMGNHDPESNLGVDWQCAQYENSEYCLFKQRTLIGNGNYSVGIKQGEEIKRVFYMLDSNGCANASEETLNNKHTKTTFGFGEDQIEWYTQSINNLKEVYPNVKLSFAFHAPIKAFKDSVVNYGISSSVGNNPIIIDEVGNSGDYGVIAEDFNPWDTDNRVWNGLKSLGVDSIFVGHNHRNNSSVMYEGVRLTFGQKSSTYDTICYYNKQTGEVGISNADGKVAMIGGNCIPVSSVDGSITNPSVLLYDESDTSVELEEDTSNIRVPTVDNVSETVGSYRGFEFARYSLQDIGAQDKTLTDGFSVPVDVNNYSLKFKVKTTSNHTKGTLRFFFYTTEGKRTDYSIAITSSYVSICGQSIPIALKANTEYDIELGVVQVYRNKTVYMFVKIDGELANRWKLSEVNDLNGNYLYVTQSGSADLCEFVK